MLERIRKLTKAFANGQISYSEMWTKINKLIAERPDQRKSDQRDQQPTRMVG